MSQSEGKSAGASYVEEVHSVRKPTFAGKLKAHLRKWWWAHLIVFLLSTLTISLLLVYVAFPRISQNGINKSTLEIQSLKLSNPTPTSFHLEQVAITGNDSPYHPQLDAFNASLSIAGQEDKPYAYIEVPAINAQKVSTTLVNQTVQITDLDQFSAYNTLVLSNEKLGLSIHGKTPLHEMAFPATTVDYKKVVTMKGLNKLNGFNITSFTIKLTPDADGTNMDGFVYIPNPTVMTLAMGNVTFNNYAQGDLIGNSTLSDLVLTPGNNTIPLRSIVNQTIVLEKVLTTFKDGMMPIDIVGLSAIYNGQHLPYFEKALAANTQHVTLNVGAALKAVGFTVPGT